MVAHVLWEHGVGGSNPFWDAKKLQASGFGACSFLMLFAVPVCHAAALLLHKAAMAMDRDLGEGCFQRGKLVFGQAHVPGSQIFQDACLIYRKDNEESYASHTFYSFDDYVKQLAIREHQYNNFPMRPLNWKSPKEVLFAFPNV